MPEIDERKALIAYHETGYDMVMSYNDFKTNFGHFYYKGGPEHSCRTCKRRKTCTPEIYRGCYINGRQYWEEDNNIIKGERK